MVAMESCARFSWGSVRRSSDQFGAPRETDFASMLDKFCASEKALEDAIGGPLNYTHLGTPRSLVKRYRQGAIGIICF